MSNTPLIFPKDFQLGCATAAFQIEGATHEDGRGNSIWDTFCRTPGNITTGENGDIACDHYHRYKEDIQLMRTIGVSAYRFSIAWPRIFPQGNGPINSKGLDFYNRLVDELLKANIQPFVTLYHWDLPQALQDKGGWANRDTVYYYRDYAGEMARQLGDRVQGWITHNEPWVVTFLGHYWGVHAPGIKSLSTALQVSHHLLLSHGEAVSAIRQNSPSQTKVGITLILTPFYPASAVNEDHLAAQRYDGNQNRWFLDPLFKGEYPEDMVKLYGNDTPEIEQDDMKVIQSPIDFLGLNYYSRGIIKYDTQSAFFRGKESKPKDSEYTEMDWEIYPKGLYVMLKRLHEEYHVPAIYITENGAAFKDTLTADDKVREHMKCVDPQRVDYLQKHFEQAYQAIQDGVPLKGYFIWSLLDNFEWTWGYSKRFGIVYTDYPTQHRILKQSGKWYQNLIQQNKSQ